MVSTKDMEAERNFGGMGYGVRKHLSRSARNLS